THLYQRILRFELVLERNLRHHHAGRDADNNQSDNQDSHPDSLPHFNLPPVSLLSDSRTRWFSILLEEAGKRRAPHTTFPGSTIPPANFTAAAWLPPPPGQLLVAALSSRFLRPCPALVRGLPQPVFWCRGRPAGRSFPACRPTPSARHPSGSAVDCASPAGRRRILLQWHRPHTHPSCCSLWWRRPCCHRPACRRYGRPHRQR